MWSNRAICNVIIPTYNCREYICEAIDTILVSAGVKQKPDKSISTSLPIGRLES